MLMLLWPLENSGFKILPSDTQRTTGELADASAKLEAWRTQMFHTITIRYGFWNYKFLFVNIWYSFQ